MLRVTVMSTVVKAPHGLLPPITAEAMLALFNALGMRVGEVSAGPVVQLDPSSQDPDLPPTRVKLFPAGSVAFVPPISCLRFGRRCGVLRHHCETAANETPGWQRNGLG